MYIPNLFFWTHQAVYEKRPIFAFMQIIVTWRVTRHFQNGGHDKRKYREGNFVILQWNIFLDDRSYLPKQFSVYVIMQDVT